MRSDWERMMPGEVGTVFHVLWQEVSWMIATWEVFKELYTKGEERADTLTWAAPTFFNLTNRLLTQEIFLALSRLTDPPKGAGRINSSLQKLADALRDAGCEQMAEEVRERVSKISSDCKPIRQRRNRVIAHSDLNTALEPEKELVPGMTIDEIDQAMSAIVELMNYTQAGIQDSTTHFNTNMISVEAENLILYLEKAREAEERKRMPRSTP